MTEKDDDLDVLQNLEFCVVEIWRANREMSDHAALHAYEAALQRYRAESLGHPLKPANLGGLEATAFASVIAMCEFRLGRGTGPLAGPPPVPLEKIVAALRKLAKSVERHTKHGGRHGYLTFIDQFLK